VPLEVLVNKFSYMRFDPEGMTKNQEIPFAKSMPDYIMRWLASRFIEDIDLHEDLGILTKDVRARKDAQQALFSPDTAGPANGNGNGNGNGTHAETEAPAATSGAAAAAGSSQPAAAAMTDTPPVVPVRMTRELELGPACDQCGGMMQRTGSCYTCTSCGNNTGCG
jgi:ribonucleoside-diphosphate reductase alpha chain